MNKEQEFLDYYLATIILVKQVKDYLTDIQFDYMMKNNNINIKF